MIAEIALLRAIKCTNIFTKYLKTASQVWLCVDFYDFDSITVSQWSILMLLNYGFCVLDRWLGKKPVVTSYEEIANYPQVFKGS